MTSFQKTLASLIEYLALSSGREKVNTKFYFSDLPFNPVLWSILGHKVRITIRHARLTEKRHNVKKGQIRSPHDSCRHDQKSPQIRSLPRPNQNDLQQLCIIDERHLLRAHPYVGPQNPISLFPQLVHCLGSLCLAR